MAKLLGFAEALADSDLSKSYALSAAGAGENSQSLGG